MLAETFPDKARAPGAAMLQSAAAFGPWFASLINLQIPAHQWRWLFLVGIGPAIVTVFLRLGVKEPERPQRDAAQEKQGLDGLFAEPVWRRNALVALLLGIAGIAASNNVSYWLPNLTKAVSAGLSADIAQARTSYVTLSLHVGTLFGVFAMPWFCERVGRRKALAVFFVMSAVTVAAATLGGTTYHRLLLLAPLMSLFSIGMSAGFVLYFPELFPARFRATGAGLAYNGGRIFAAGVPFITASLLGDSNSVFTAVALTAILPVVIGLLALVNAPETRGRGLPEG